MAWPECRPRGRRLPRLPLRPRGPAVRAAAAGRLRGLRAARGRLPGRRAGLRPLRGLRPARRDVRGARCAATELHRCELDGHRRAWTACAAPRCRGPISSAWRGRWRARSGSACSTTRTRAEPAPAAGGAGRHPEPRVRVARPAPAELVAALAQPDRRDAPVAAARAGELHAVVAVHHLRVVRDERDALVQRERGALLAPRAARARRRAGRRASRRRGRRRAPGTRAPRARDPVDRAPSGRGRPRPAPTWRRRCGRAPGAAARATTSRNGIRSSRARLGHAPRRRAAARPAPRGSPSAAAWRSNSVIRMVDTVIRWMIDHGSADRERTRRRCSTRPSRSSPRRASPAPA